MFFLSTEEIKEHVAVNTTFDWEDIRPQLSQGLSQHIMPAIGRTFTAQLLGAYETHSQGQGDATEAELLAIAKIQAALAPYAVYLWVPIGYVQQSAMGIQEASSEHSSPARQWVTYDLRKALLDQADVALEDLLAFLEENADDYPGWKNSDSYTRLSAGFISSATELSEEVNVSGSRRLFLMLKPYLRRTQKLYIKPVLGNMLYQHLLDTKLNDQLADEEILLLDEIKTSLAHLTLAKAIPELSLEIGEEGIKLASASNGLQQRNSPSGSRGDTTLLSAHQQSLQQDGEALLDSLKEFLFTHEEDYPMFRESNLYKADVRGDSWLDDTDPDDKVFIL